MIKKLQERLERYKENHSAVSAAIVKFRENLAEAEKFQSQLEALISEMDSIIKEEDESNKDSGSKDEGRPEDSLGGVEVGEEPSSPIKSSSSAASS
jgi:hypothetical protein